MKRTWNPSVGRASFPGAVHGDYDWTAALSFVVETTLHSFALVLLYVINEAEEIFAMYEKSALRSWPLMSCSSSVLCNALLEIVMGCRHTT
jgi:hypothetical protein